MTNHVVAEFKINHRQILDQNGELVDSIPKFLDETTLLHLYEHMIFTRMFDTKTISLQRTGKTGTYASSLGQEAIGGAIGYVMRPDDLLCPYYRDCAAQFQRGVTPEDILRYWGGNEIGSAYDAHDLRIAVPIASQTLHAAGAALAMKIRGQQNAVLTTIGDGGTSRGDFYEAMNFCGVHKLPVVFVVNNNQWAISVPIKLQTASATFAQKGIACNVPGIRVDGNDIMVLCDEIQAALERAYAGEGPSIIEAVSYRMGDHTTADDAKRYRDEAELEAAKPTDPISRLQKYLANNKLLDDKQQKAIEEKLTTKLNKSIDNYLSTPKPNPTDMFDYLYAQLPEQMKSQRDMVEEYARNNIN